MLDLSEVVGRMVIGASFLGHFPIARRVTGAEVMPIPRAGGQFPPHWFPPTDGVGHAHADSATAPPRAA
jgi:hypothetical protein